MALNSVLAGRLRWLLDLYQVRERLRSCSLTYQPVGARPNFDYSLYRFQLCQ